MHSFHKKMKSIMGGLFATAATACVLNGAAFDVAQAETAKFCLTPEGVLLAASVEKDRAYVSMGDVSSASNIYRSDDGRIEMEGSVTNVRIKNLAADEAERMVVAAKDAGSLFKATGSSLLSSSDEKVHALLGSNGTIILMWSEKAKDYTPALDSPVGPRDSTKVQISGPSAIVAQLKDLSLKDRDGLVKTGRVPMTLEAK